MCRCDKQVIENQIIHIKNSNTTKMKLVQAIFMDKHLCYVHILVLNSELKPTTALAKRVSGVNPLLVAFVLGK